MMSTETNPAGRAPVLLIRPDGNEADASALRALGLQPLIDPYLQVRPVTDAAGAEALLAALEPGRPGWLLLTSKRALPAWGHLVGQQPLLARLRNCAEAGWRVAAVGPATAATAPELSWPAPLVPQRATAADLAAAVVAAGAPARAVIPQGTIALAVLGQTLHGAGWEVFARAVYQTQPVTPSPPSALAVARGDIAAVVLRSPSAARALFTFGPPAPGVVLVAAGATTATSVRELGREPVLSVTPHARDVAAAVSAALAR